MKAYTDIEQSKVLAEILPLESADMYWYLATKGNPKAMFNEEYNEYGDFELPCWSLSALLDVLPNGNMLVKTTDGEYYCLAKDVMTKHYDNPVDVCADMIIRLKK